MHRRTFVIRLPLSVVALALLSSTAQQEGKVLMELNLRQEQWKAAEIHHYVYRLNVSCFCPFNNVSVDIEVKNGEAISIKNAATGESVTHSFFTPYNTIDRLFDEIQREIETHADLLPNGMTVSGEFDPTYSFPRRFAIQYTQPGNDASITYTIQRFENLNRS